MTAKVGQSLGLGKGAGIGWFWEKRATRARGLGDGSYGSYGSYVLQRGGASRTLGRRGSAFGVRVGVGRLRVRLGFARAIYLRSGLGEVPRAVR